MLFSTFTNNTANRNDCSLSKLVYDTKLSGASDTPEGWNAIHRKLNKLKKRVHKNLISFNKIKSKLAFQELNKSKLLANISSLKTINDYDLKQLSLAPN
ncbi:hypothetical protein TURU_159880 [Turdus rufiventris]|nr:hypothetical protein TURU_159880 [Turdus rufiventris]